MEPSLPSSFTLSLKSHPHRLWTILLQECIREHLDGKGRVGVWLLPFLIIFQRTNGVPSTLQKSSVTCFLPHHGKTRI